MFHTRIMGRLRCSYTQQQGRSSKAIYGITPHLTDFDPRPHVLFKGFRLDVIEYGHIVERAATLEVAFCVLVAVHHLAKDAALAWQATADLQTSECDMFVRA